MKAALSCALTALALAACDGTIGTPGRDDPGRGDRSNFATAGGLWDQGFQQAIARSELGDISSISIGSCLYPGACPAGMSCSPCPTGPSTYSQSNFFSTVSPAPTTSYWVVDHNNDTGALALSFDSCNSGPPDQSLPVTNGTSGATVFNLQIGQGSAGRRAQLRLRNQYNPCVGGIPYLAIGANKARGNGGKDVGYFVRSNSGTTGFSTDVSTVSFNAAITECSGDPCLFYFNIHARYNGKPRLLVLTIGHINHAGNHAAHAHWSWPVQQSYFYSGYDIVYLRCTEAGAPCLTVSASGTAYKLSMSELLATASPLFDDPIAVGAQVSIEGVSWALETAGSASEAAGWVEGMRVEGTAPSGGSCQGSCGGKAGTCWCDSLCSSYGDCCSDHASVCSGAPSPPPSSSSPPVVSFSSVQDGSGSSVTLTTTQTLHGKVTGLSGSNAQACLEVVGRPITEQNGDGWCGDLSHWTTMTSSSAAGSWSHQGGIWRLTLSPVGSLFPAGSYRGFWRNSATGQQALGQFTVQGGVPADPTAWCKVVGGAGASLFGGTLTKSSCAAQCQSYSTTNPNRTCTWGSEVIFSPQQVTLACHHSSTQQDRWCAAGSPPDASYGLQSDKQWRIMVTAAADTYALYNCKNPGGTDYMVSASCGVEGYGTVALIGQIWKATASGRVPIYRCYTAQGDHFLTGDASCEGHNADNGGKPIGHAIPAGTSPPPSTASGGSCNGQCDKKSSDGTCWCDSLCAQYGDCCADKTQHCG